MLRDLGGGGGVAVVMIPIETELTASTMVLRGKGAWCVLKKKQQENLCGLNEEREGSEMQL